MTSRTRFFAPFDISGYFFGKYCKRHSTAAEALQADLDSIRGDWELFGESLRQAMIVFEEEHDLEILSETESDGRDREPVRG
jgi:hypothetical protein